MSYQYYNLLNPSNFPPSDYWRDRFYNGPPDMPLPLPGNIDFSDPMALVEPIATGNPNPGSNTMTEEENSDDEKKNYNMGGGRYSGSVQATKNVNLKKKGMKFIFESSGKVFDYNCVYVGHTSCNLDRALLVVCCALVRAMLAKMGFSTNNPWDFAYPTDAIWQVDVKNFPTAPGVSSDYQTTIVSTPQSIYQLASVLKTKIDTIYNSTPNAIVSVLRTVPRVDLGIYNVTTLSKQINLNTAIVDLSCISILKIQNTTKHLNTAGSGQDEYATAVDAAPLNGKIYRGPGQGMYAKAEDASPVWLIDGGGIGATGGAFGMILAAAGQYEEYQEPINAEQMYYCQKSNGVKFQPGELKSSHLKFYKKSTVSRMFQRLGLVHGSLSWVVPDYGNFQIFGLEKMIGIKGTNPEDNPAVEIDYEVNNEWMCYVKPVNELNPPQYFEKDFSEITTGT